MSDRDLILASLPESNAASLPEPWAVPSKTENLELLWTSLGEKLSGLGARTASLTDLKELEGRKAMIDADAKPFLKGLKFNEGPIWDAEVGITLAELAVSESGSILLANAPGRRRMASLAPEIHVALVRSDSIVRTLEEAWANIPERTCAMVTGSSRTADIEGILVRGVHGPKEVWVVRLP